MLSRKFHLSLLILSMFLFASFTNPSHAEVESVQVHLFGVVNNDDARQIRRLLKPWANPEDVSFYAPVDKNGLKRHFTTIVEVTPRRGKNPYNEGRTFDIYDIIRQLSDQRFRGSQTGGRAWVTKSEATVTGNIYAHPAFHGVTYATFLFGDVGVLTHQKSIMQWLLVRTRRSSLVVMINLMN